MNARKLNPLLALVLGLLTLIGTLALLGMLPGLSPVQADPIWYVDGAGGADDSSCGAMTASCETISYTLNTLASSGNIIRVAQGTYLENLTIDIDLTLEGGYEATGWTRDTRKYETIIDGSGNGIEYRDWDGERVRYPTVIQDGGAYKMWYVGVDIYDTGRVGYATSPDGIAWTRHSSNPVLDVGAPGAWDAMQLEGPFVIKESSSSYKMWYSGSDANGVWRIGYATSSDGVNWTKHVSNPVLDVGSQTWNNFGVLHPNVVKEGSTYKMWLLTIGDDGPHVSYATSSNGVDWTWNGASPLFGPTFEQWLWRPNVLPVGSTYHLWHSVWSSDEGRTSYASAPNETAWTKYGSPVLSGTPGEWDEGRAVDPFVIYDAPTYTMWYDNMVAIGLASTDNPTDWTKYAAIRCLRREPPRNMVSR